METACQELRASSGLAGKRAFSYSCIERNWRKEWGVGSGGSSASSRAPIHDDRGSIDE